MNTQIMKIKSEYFKSPIRSSIIICGIFMLLFIISCQERKPQIHDNFEFAKLHSNEFKLSVDPHL